MLKQKIASLSCAIALLGAPYFLCDPVSAASLAEINRRGKLIVAVKDNLRPLGFTDDRGNLQGLEIDIARQLAQEWLGSPDAVEFRPVRNQDRLPLLLQGEVDLVVANLSATEVRDRVVNLSRYYYLNSTGLVSRNPEIQSRGDLATGKIAVLQGSSTIADIRYEFPKAHLVGVESYQEARDRLEIGEIDAFAADRTLLTGWIQEYPTYRLLPVRLPGKALCIAMPKGLEYSELYLQVDRALLRWQKSGWLQERIVHWGLS
ncbi:transporter substrate-binding domain-containing protein [Lusitaniella coriacea]|uniref:transporter substrate-binding domain-containing protein n=1 Tax=Lusitaniella coriacea TaxID=1983105 RepID=UPI003CEB5C30